MDNFTDHIRETTVFADFNKPLIARTTRWEYMSRYFPLWKEVIRHKFYTYSLVGAAAYFLATTPFLAVPCLAAAAYFHSRVTMASSRLTSNRKVMINH